MKISKIGSLYNNKSILRGLKYASEHSAILTSGTAVLMSFLVRPISIMKTPDTSKKEKEFACAKSIASAIGGFSLTSLIFKPISKAIDNVSSNPEKFLSEKTIKNLSEGVSNINESHAFNSMKQIIKISPEIISTVPKAILTTALIVPIVKFLFKDNKENEKKNISFKGAAAEKFVSKMMNNEALNKAVLKNRNINFVQNSLFFKDILATGLFAGFTALNPKIKNEDKKPLINNASISTAFTILGTLGIDKLTKKPMKKITDNLIKANKNNPNLEKYLRGIDVIKPIVIMSGLYYIAIPVISTFLAGKVKNNNKDINNKNA